MRGPFLTSILWVYGGGICDADPGDEHFECDVVNQWHRNMSAVTTPAPVQQRAHVTKFIMRKIDGAIPVEYVWDKLEVGAFTSFPVMTPVMMTNEIESKFSAMQRHGWSMAKNCKTEWEIRK